MAKEGKIIIRGAHAHNLRNVDVDIPRNNFVVITGVSGSGKSTLAFDTIYAEGQRRYLNTLSPYARHFLGILEKPEVESITGLSPIIAIEQKTTGNNPRSTVGTVTEIADFLRLLYAKVARAYSPVSGKEMVRFTDSQITDLIISNYRGRKCLLLSPLVKGRKGHYRELFEQLRKKGFAEVRIDGELCSLDEVESLDRYKNHTIELVVDKLKPDEEDSERIRSSVFDALTQGKGSLAVYDIAEGSMHYFSKHFVDPDSGISLREPAPHSFSFNSPEGYCPHCKGLGSTVNIDIDSIVPDRSVSVADGGIVPLGRIRENRKFNILRSVARKHAFSLFDPIDALSDEDLSLIVFGSDEFFRVGENALAEMVNWPGVVDDIDDRIVCPVCHGTRLSEQALCFKIDGKTIADVCAMEISALREWLLSLRDLLRGRQAAIARDILSELGDRVDFLINVGLEYLTLDRPASSLSGGESQRIRLATQIGSRLVNVIYVLDEPSIGLHQKDNRKLISSLKALRDAGNSVIVVEHDAETMLAADWIVDMGPGAGEKGGEVCYQGPASDAPFIAELRKKVPRRQRRPGNGKVLRLMGARGNNLKNVTVDFPLGCMIGISGVSGSGKSSLINETLMPLLKDKLHHAKLKVLDNDGLEGEDAIDKVIEIDQSPIGRVPRSNPATFTGVMGDIRELFESTPDAKVRGFKAGRFSFNVEGGRCPACKGAGIKLVEMNFLPSVRTVCEECGGKRYKEDTLEVRYKGKNISDILEMPVSEACEFFKANPKISSKLKALDDVGLGYIRLGQSAVSLSGGESQRMKLAAELSRRASGNTLYLLDEPTTGLHAKDIDVLMGMLDTLVDQGNTVIIIEHNLDVLSRVDYIFDMGPGGGAAGGEIVAEGTPEALAANPASVTGKYIGELLE
ncbi:MAG: excinuclease ABC subunit UvrA [Bacteroidales bacterium]|nr:excinuclease ABC subunit UvrA [Bacteroidales bacterium]